MAVGLRMVSIAGAILWGFEPLPQAHPSRCLSRFQSQARFFGALSRKFGLIPAGMNQVSIAGAILWGFELSIRMSAVEIGISFNRRRDSLGL